VELQRAQLTATVVIEARFVPVLRDQFGRRHCDVQQNLDQGRVRVSVAAPTALMIAEHLAGWGALIEVIEPPSVRAELARIGAELTARYLR
jgi:predicted DNA-binding transcriptional regulator YafY